MLKKLKIAILGFMLGSSASIAGEFELSLWARDPLLRNPTSISFDNRGRLYVAETARRGGVDLDIRAHKPWILEDLANQSVDDFRAFARRRLAPDQSDASREWLPDHNADGSHDWRDLTTVTESVRLLEDTNGDGKGDASHLFADGFNEEITGVLEGVMWHDSGDVFATVFPDLWRLRDTNGDGVADEKESVFRGFGVHAAFDGHDIHGLTVGPDGKLYFSVGDNGFSVVTKEGRRIHHPNTGGVLRCDFDGSNLEVFAFGLRNPQEIAFDQYGYLFTVDNDGDLEDERERFVYIAEGSDSGWRINWQFRTTGWGKYTGQPDYNPWIADGMWKPHHDGQPAYITPPLSNYSVGPGGFRYNPGSALTERYRDYFFLVQFPVAKITAFRAEPKGAGFAMVDEHVFHQGLMASCVEWSPDGALFIADWEGKWQPNDKGAIYRLDNPIAAKRPIRQQVATLIREGVSDKTDEQLVNLLGHVDQRIRLRAQFALVARKRGELLQRVAVGTGPQLARIHALWGLGQLSNSDGLVLPFEDSDSEIRGQAAKVAGNLHWSGAYDSLVGLLNDSAPRVRFQAAVALGKLGQREAVPALVEMLAENGGDDAFLRHAGVFAMATIGDSSAVANLAMHRSRFVRIAAVVALRRLRDPSVVDFLGDADTNVVREAVRAIHDDFSISVAMPALAKMLGKSPHVNDEAIMRRAISANFRLGMAEHAERLAAFAVNEQNPEALRLEALESLATWERKPFVDRVVGRVRTPDGRMVGAGMAAVSSHLPEWIASSTEAIQSAIARIADELGLESGDATFREWALSNDRPSAVRIAALRTLDARNLLQLQDTLEVCLKSEDVNLRIACLEIMGRRQPGRALAYLEENFVQLPIPEQQSGLGILAKLATSRADKIIENTMRRQLDGQLSPELELDVIEAADVRAARSSSLRTLLDMHVDSNPGERFALHGGDAQIGRELFYNHVAAQCVRCHSIGSSAVGVGPDLNGVGMRFDRAYLLNALIDPSAVIAEGFSLLTVEKRNGEIIGGTLVKETESQIELVTAAGEVVVVADADIVERTAAAVSSMPPMAGILSKRELRDMIAFLAGLDR